MYCTVTPIAAHGSMKACLALKPADSGVLPQKQGQWSYIQLSIAVGTDFYSW